MGEFDKAREFFSAFEKGEDLESLSEAVAIVEDIVNNGDAECSKALRLFGCYRDSQISRTKQLLSSETHLDQCKRQWDILNEFASIEINDNQYELKEIMNELLCEEFGYRFDELIKAEVKYQTTGKGQSTAEKRNFFLKELAKRFWKKDRS